LRATPKASSGMSFCISPFAQSESAHTCGPLRLSSWAMFVLHNASDTRSPSCRGVVQKEGQPSDPPGDADPGDADRACIARRHALPRYTAADVKLASVAASIPFCGVHPESKSRLYVSWPSSRRASNCYAHEYGTPAVVMRSVGLHARKPKGGYEQSLRVPAACQRMPGACT
jgi:hypothetical protein